MALTVAQLAVKVQAEGADETKEKLHGVSEGFDGAKTHGDDFFKHMLEATGIVAGFELVKKGVEILGDQLGDVIQAGMRAQDTQAQLGAVLKSTGDASGYSADQANKLADQLSQTTTFSADANLHTEELLMTFTNIGQNVFPTATKAVLDMSTALGEDTKSASIQLGKALQDPITGATALRRVGVELDDQQKALIKTMMAHGDVAGAQGVILKELQREFGGSAEAAGHAGGG
ncbi:MAG TPA: phage tail length tape measure family protein, partial [Ktedonobacterales bacterium]|nr:phage tail length tape measure family protein [Ktedonobacterales bacterium]